MLTLIGSYDPIITIEHYTRQGTTTLTYITDISPDYTWIYSAILLIIVMFSVFKLLGGFVCKL